MTTLPTTTPEFDCRSSTDWFPLSQQHPTFRLRWERPLGRGWEAYHRLAPGCWLRTLDLEQADGSSPARISGGYLSLAAMLEGRTTLEAPEGGAFELNAGQMMCNYRRDDALFVDHCPRPGRYLMVELNLSPDYLRRSLTHLASKEFAFLVRLGSSNGCLVLTSALHRCLRDILHPPVGEPLLTSYLRAKSGEFLCLLLASHTQPVPTPTLLAGDRLALEKARRLLLDDLARPPGFAELGRRIGMSERRLKQRFKEYHGQTLSDCLRQARLREAQRLLDDGALTIAQVADALGYEHAANFATAFKRDVGLTPRAYRRRHRLPC
ncbi:helix-turn-helix domain-containing protein [Halomonas litopenaei]|uniref:helix-turn-helix domain-containing protein n=1 Tax=Halomonas litopenaei TaxID=2109328 RepID=UPI001A8DD5CC|nr:AraC family transcriptional regulator [Halomonas litopenaei]MBN8412705.1 helix-turn-helix transcriptional regulator [Halomonas litopenaei]